MHDLAILDYVPGDRAEAVSAARMSSEVLRAEAAEFVRAIECDGPPATDGWAGLRVVEILEAATRSHGRARAARGAALNRTAAKRAPTTGSRRPCG